VQYFVLHSKYLGTLFPYLSIISGFKAFRTHEQHSKLRHAASRSINQTAFVSTTPPFVSPDDSFELGGSASICEVGLIPLAPRITVHIYWKPPSKRA
jgi:hypothetical protein